MDREPDGWMDGDRASVPLEERAGDTKHSGRQRLDGYLLLKRLHKMWQGMPIFRRSEATPNVFPERGNSETSRESSRVAGGRGSRGRG
ncbi:hypothetical protein CSOJ01_00199 [Colletotrichum sojae]|uniref:Uncharacterized protein n=1 Tax=Colletotrichum sojae TaxID=2175907 RepID=A0A8H6JZT2_9PEZI|nr:hypothetical protein CSOJ01_00199 [Colletotrichum sojae]